MKKVLFIDRDGTLIRETPDEQIDSFEKLLFYPDVLFYMSKIVKELDFELVMITNQDGLGTECDATAGEPSDEICDALDNDCDGEVDEELNIHASRLRSIKNIQVDLGKLELVPSREYTYLK